MLLIYQCYTVPISINLFCLCSSSELVGVVEPGNKNTSVDINSFNTPWYWKAAKWINMYIEHVLFVLSQEKGRLRFVLCSNGELNVTWRWWFAAFLLWNVVSIAVITESCGGQTCLRPMWYYHRAVKDRHVLDQCDIITEMWRTEMS